MASPITDDYMREHLGRSRVYSVVLLRATDRYDRDAAPGSEQRRIIWEHGRRNFELRAKGLMCLVGPLANPPIVGMGVFNVSLEETATLMKEDPAVEAGFFSFEVMPWRSFPGDALGEGTVG